MYLIFYRSTSISNVTGASLSRRSSERELTDSGAKKRATSAGGTDRHEGKCKRLTRTHCHLSRLQFVKAHKLVNARNAHRITN